MSEWIELGYLGLFLASFLAATVLPLSSDALLLAMLLGPFDPAPTIAVATFGNWVGGMSSYYLGYLGRWQWIEKYLRVSRSRIERINAWLANKGSWIAFWCWLPIIGDPLAIALGFLRSKPIPTALWMLLGKFLRYLAIAWIAHSGKVHLEEWGWFL